MTNNEQESDEPKDLISISSKGIHIVSEKVAEKLAKKSISPSMITSLAQCPAKWAAESLAVREIVEEEPDNAARRGNIFHKTMEIVFALPEEERTPKAVKKALNETLESDEFKDLKDNKEVLHWAKEAINGYYRMGGRPERVKVAVLKVEGEKPRVGLEVFVSGKIGNSKRNTLGFIDRLAVDQSVVAEDELPAEEGIIIEDWKTGAKAKKWNPKTKSEDGLAEARQQVIYAMLLKLMGVKVTGARLIFPVAQEVVNIDIEDPDFQARVIKDVEDTDEALDLYIKNNTFEFRPNFLCSWCPISKICPKADLKPFPKARDAHRGQPEPEVLAKGIKFLD